MGAVIAVSVAAGTCTIVSSAKLPLGRATVSSFLEDATLPLASRGYLSGGHTFGDSVFDTCASGNHAADHSISPTPSFDGSLPFVLSGCPFSAFPIPALNRFSMGAFSPLSGQMRISSSGGYIGQYLFNLGIGSLVIQGSLHKKTRATLVLSKTGPRLDPTIFTPDQAGEDRMALLRKQYGAKATLLCTSQAAEMQYPIAQLMVSTTAGHSFRFSGRNGPAVALAAAGISAIVFDKKTPRPQPNKDIQPLLARFCAAIDNSIPTMRYSEFEKMPSLNEGTADINDLSCFRHCLECSSPCPIKKTVKERLSFSTTLSNYKNSDSSTKHDGFLESHHPLSKSLTLPETFYTDCNRLGLDRTESIYLVKAAVKMQMLPYDIRQAAKSFMEHMEQKTPLGQNMGNGVQWFTQYYAGETKKQPEHKRSSRISGSYRELLAALDCVGVCMSAAKTLATEEGMEIFLNLLNAIAPARDRAKKNEPKKLWTQERFLGLGKDTLSRERNIITQQPLPRAEYP